MTDLLIDPQTGDLVLQAGDVVTVTAAEGTGQRIRDRLSTAIGEWFLDTEFGLPLFDQILVKNPPLSVVSALLKTEILDAAGDGAALTRFSLVLDSATRRLSAEYDVSLPVGSVTGSIEIGS